MAITKNFINSLTMDDMTKTKSVSVVLAVTLLKEHLYSVRLVTLILIGVTTYTQIDQA